MVITTGFQPVILSSSLSSSIFLMRDGAKHRLGALASRKHKGFYFMEKEMGDNVEFTDEAIDKCRVVIIDNMRWLLPLKYALAALNMSEEDYNRIKKSLENV